MENALAMIVGNRKHRQKPEAFFSSFLCSCISLEGMYSWREQNTKSQGMTMLYLGNQALLDA